MVEKVIKKIEEIDYLAIAEKSLKENEIPIILFDENDENKEYVAEFLSYESERVIFCNIRKNNQKKLIRMSIKAQAFYTQFLKFDMKEKDIFSVKYLGVKSQDSGFDYKSFVMKKFDIVTKKFLTTKQL